MKQDLYKLADPTLNKEKHSGCMSPFHPPAPAREYNDGLLLRSSETGQKGGRAILVLKCLEA